MKILFSILALMLVFAGSANAQWTSPGNGTIYDIDALVTESDGGVVCLGEQPYSQERPVYRFMADITISPNDHLLIPEHNFIEFDDVTLTIQGSLTVENLHSDPGNFFDKSPENENAHPRIRIEDATGASMFERCVFLTFSGIQIINSEVTFNNCHINHFDTFHQSSAINIMNCDPVFTNCSFYSNEGAAISSPANANGSPQILNCYFLYNVVDNTNQPQINLGPGAADTIRIVNCTIKGGSYDMSGGISVADLMGTGDTKILLKDNIIKNNRYGYNQQGYRLGSLIIGNQFLDNNLEANPNNGGSGVSIYGMDANNKAKLRNNLISGNLWGITTIYYHDVDMGTEDDWGHNVLFGNGNGGAEYAIYNNGYSDVYAIGNYWGYNEEEQIESVIWHSVGEVIWRPYYELHPEVLDLVASQEMNPSLPFSTDYHGVIDAESQTITLSIPEEELIFYGNPMTHVTLSLILPLGISCSIDTPYDFMISIEQPYNFTLSAPHGETQEWTILPETYTYLEEPNLNPIAVCHLTAEQKILISGLQEPSQVRVCNLSGQTLYCRSVENQSMTLSTSGFPKGIYIVTIVSFYGSESRKIIVD
jgi:hypothetical protein